MATVIGCGNSCFVGFSNNGNGVVIVKAGNPPPPCSLPQTTGMMSVLAVKSSVCESCPAPHPQHIFVTLQGIQLHSSPVAGPTSPDWHEIAPRLADEPLLIDLIGGSVPEVLVDYSPAPAGTYRQVRLRFLPDSEYAPDRLPRSPCGEARHNCVVLADGRVESLPWASEENPDLLIASDALQGGSIVVPPGAKTDLLLVFGLSQRLYSSAAEPLQLRSFLTGRATIRQSPAGQPAN